ncbi:hypothetical protein OAB57_00400 [Bacteriovoracaceae bacterium]|nr:hypothetical protein [Bacteriovoracaceae bacterium]
MIFSRVNYCAMFFLVLSSPLYGTSGKVVHLDCFVLDAKLGVSGRFDIELITGVENKVKKEVTLFSHTETPKLFNATLENENRNIKVSLFNSANKHMWSTEASKDAKFLQLTLNMSESPRLMSCEVTIVD